MLREFLNKKKPPQLIDRDGERYEVTLRVLSRDLPGFRGVTLDLSRSGVQLETGGLLNIGDQPVLKFEFDRGELESFECRARVIWSRQEENSRSKYRSGLTFVPETDDEKRQLVRMATVLQTRSDADLRTLLDQATRIDPELERSYANISTNNYSHYAQPDPKPVEPVALKPVQQASPIQVPPLPEPTPIAPQVQEPAPAQHQQAPAPPQTHQPRHPGVYIPLNVILEGYTWNRATRTLHLGIREGDEVHSLFFPNCQLFQVMEPAGDELIVGLYSTATSPATRRLESGVDTQFKHYRFVAEGGKGLVDIVSQACKSKL